MRYCIAALPDGCFALRTDFTYVGFAGQSFPWSAFPTREACVSEFLSRARAFFHKEPTGCAAESDRQGRLQILPMLAETLFGFAEPPPQTEDQLRPRVDDEADAEDKTD